MHAAQARRMHDYLLMNDEQRSWLGNAAFQLLWALVFVVPLENVVVPGIGLVAVAVGLIASGVCLLAIIERGTVRRLSPGHVLLAVFAMWAALSYLWTFDPRGTLLEVPVYLRLFLMVWLIWQLAPEAGQQIRLLQAYVFGTFAAGVDTIYQFIRQNEAAYLRYAGAGANPDDLGLMAALSVPIAYCCFIEIEGRIRWLYAAHMALAAITILLTGTRAAALAMGVALLIVPASVARLKRRQVAGILLTAVLIVVVALSIVPASSRDRLSTIPNELAGGSMSGRTDIWAAGLELFQEHPVIGVGAGAYLQSVRHILFVPIVAHNTFLSVLVELGIVGLGIFCVLLGYLLLSALELPWLPKRLWLACLSAWLVGVSSLTWEMRKPTWLFFGLLLSQHGSLGRRAATTTWPLQRPERVQRHRSLVHIRQASNDRCSQPQLRVTS
jgi:O-antigen ligase